MEKFTRLTATACPIDIVNLNTDQILPARYLKQPRSAGYGQFLFHDLRRDAEGNERPEFPLNRAPWREARIVVGGRNFGCGSSREAAVYALYDAGIRCAVGASFGDIFCGKAVQNGLLTAIVSDQEAADLMADLTQHADRPLTVDLEAQTIVTGNRTIAFTIDPVRRTRLLNGWDDIALTESFRDQIAAFKQADRASRPWAKPAAPCRNSVR